jgi:hypothetical protein
LADNPPREDEATMAIEYQVLLCFAQGAYFLLTGVWPLLSIDTFQRVTGPKTDLWLVKTVGVLVAVIGIVLVTAGVRQRVTPEVLLLGVGTALGLTAIDVVYVTKRVIRPIYLLDAAIEIVLVTLWSVAAAGDGIVRHG